MDLSNKIRIFDMWHPKYRLAAQLGVFGKKAQKEANEAAEEEAPVIALLLLIFTLLGICYLILKGLGIVS